MNSKNKLTKMKGQITIFVALVFMVLFTLFGMTISMGMFIHDKINLQNATDLASYYVATKQAEMLTAIAHSNYQIRQSWKLAVFRYRVYGNGTRTRPIADFHPGIGLNPLAFEGDHSVYEPAKGRVVSGVYMPPRICMVSAHIIQEGAGDNLCKELDFNIGYIPPVPSIIPISIVGATNTTVTAANTAILERCSKSAYINWWYANTIVGAHKLEQRDRRAVINELAKNLMQPIAPGGMKDLDGRDVYEGAEKTFLYNLSESNRENLSTTASIVFKNSMEELGGVEEWLAPIYVNLSVPYSSFTSSGAGCGQQLNNHMEEGGILTYTSGTGLASINELKGALDPNTRVKAAGEVARYSDDLYNITIGVEKNPWYMVYNKAIAEAVSKPLFLSEIFGAGIKMSSIGYSKPFGGRIGPWYKMQWSSGSNESDSGDRTDELVPVRVDNAGIGAFSPSTYDETLFPNYSRYPGDQDGMVTKSSMVAVGKLIGWDWSGPPVSAVDTSISNYIGATYSYFNTNYNDPLAQDTTPSSTEPWNSFNRRMEIAAIAPDMFDATYYTIVPGFYDYFIEGRLDQWLPPLLPAEVELRGDLGAHADGPDGIKNFDIEDQMNISALTATEDGIARDRTAPWLDNPNKKAFLSSWVPGDDVMNYEAADQGDVKDKFAACATGVPNGRAKIPSECLKGGRTGYSVKMISKKYLEADHPIGGDGTSGPILNIY